MTGLRLVKYTDDVKSQVLELWSEYAVDVDKYCLQDAADKAFRKVTGHRGYYNTIRGWAKQSEEIGEIYANVILARADYYQRKCQRLIDDAENKMFFDHAKFGRTEIKSMVNKIKLEIEHYRWHSACLAPELYGDYYHEIKRMQSQVDAATKRLDDLIVRAG